MDNPKNRFSIRAIVQMLVFIVLVPLLPLLIRTDLEDRTLKQELPGYREFAQKTRYRLLPGIW